MSNKYNKDNFIFHIDTWQAAFDNLSGDQFKKLVSSICKYAKEGIEPDFSDDIACKIISSYIIPRLDVDSQNYQKRCEARSKAGKASGQIRKVKSQGNIENSVQDYTNNSTLTNHTVTKNTNSSNNSFVQPSKQKITKSINVNSIHQDKQKETKRTNLTNVHFVQQNEQNEQMGTKRTDYEYDMDSEYDSVSDSDIDFENESSFGGISSSLSSLHLNTQSEKLEQHNSEKETVPIGFYPREEKREERENTSTKGNPYAENQNTDKTKGIHNVRDQDALIKIPTFEEVQEFCYKNDLNVDSVKFYNYYNDLNWHTTNGNPVYNWQSLIKKWDSNNSKLNNNYAFQGYQTDKEKKAFNGSDYLLNIIQQEHQKKVCVNG